jgi:pimeloyl-ACP methyl ester carboxylesterase
VALVTATLGANFPVAAAADTAQVMHRTVEIDGRSIFYREAGPTDAPTILLLHGFPTSSHMFRNLIPSLADEFHLVAPDYPGYGNSSMPSVDEFDYSFDKRRSRHTNNQS